LPVVRKSEVCQVDATIQWQRLGLKTLAEVEGKLLHDLL